MIALSLIRDISVSSSLKEKVGGTCAAERMRVVGRDVIAPLSPRRKMEIARSPWSTGMFLVTTGLLQISISIPSMFSQIPAAGRGWKLDFGEGRTPVSALGNSHAGVLFYLLLLLCRESFHRCLQYCFIHAQFHSLASSFISLPVKTIPFPLPVFLRGLFLEYVAQN